MTIVEARENIGNIVVYRSHPTGKPQDGTIVRVKEHLVYVRYGHNDVSIQATPPHMLTLLSKVGA